MGIIRDFEKRIKEAGGTREFYTGVIYCYTNMINGKKYIGQTIEEERRRKEHKSLRYSSYFHEAVKKYGWDNFKYEILYRKNYLDEETLHISLNLMEIYYINKFNSYYGGYNATLGGNLIVTKEIKQKISDSLKGHIPWNKGRKMTEQEKQIHKSFIYSQKGKDAWNKGKQMTKEWRDNLEENYCRMRMAIVQLTKDNKYIQTFNSLTEAAKAVNGAKSPISACALKKKNYNTAYGYKWIYLKEYEKQFTE